MRILTIIPARYASTRFPGKPLVDIGGKPMIIRVVERALAVCPDVVVATDDERIFTTVTEQGYRAVMTSPDHQSGTERCLEAYQLLGEPADVLTIYREMSPSSPTSRFVSLSSAFDDPSVDLATLAQPFPSTGDQRRAG